MASNAFPVRHCRSLAIFKFAGFADSSTRLLKGAQKSSNFCLSPLNEGTFNGLRNRLRSSSVDFRDSRSADTAVQAAGRSYPPCSR